MNRSVEILQLYIGKFLPLQVDHLVMIAYKTPTSHQKLWSQDKALWSNQGLHMTIQQGSPWTRQEA